MPDAALAPGVLGEAALAGGKGGGLIT